MSDVRDFGARGDGQIDDSAAIEHCIQDGEGLVHFPPGDYRITRTIRVDLAKTGRLAIDGSGGTAKIIMAGEGPAFQIVGSHEKNAEPSAFAAGVWARERMPTFLNLEIEGRHPQAEGFLIDGTMQATFEGLLLRELLHGIHVRRRCRNLLITHCHIYNNRGVGVFLDQVNLHQAIISGSHISYCKRAGIKIAGSEIRNLQITGNDIEYNFDLTGEPSADVWIDATAEGCSVREGTIASNTIQAKYSPGGANIRMVGFNTERNHKAGMFAISGNLIGSQETNVHLVACRGVVVSGNVLYSGHQRNLHVEGSRNVIATGNSFDHNPDYEPRELCTGVRLADSHDCTLSDSIIHDCQTGQHTVNNVQPIERQALVEIVRCRRVIVSACQVLDAQPVGIQVSDSSLVSITGCAILETRSEKKTRAAIRFLGPGSGNYLATNTLGAGIDAPATAGVKVGENQLVSDV